MKTHVENVAGVKIPKYDYTKENSDSKMDLMGLGAGGQQVAKCKDTHGKTLELLVNLASLQTAFLTLDVAIKTTNRRVNALENVVKPRVANTIQYIKVRPAVTFFSKLNYPFIGYFDPVNMYFHNMNTSFSV